VDVVDQAPEVVLHGPALCHAFAIRTECLPACHTLLTETQRLGV
jgi:hypothetical protein